MKVYNWQQDDWPRFRYDLTANEQLLYRFTEMNGRTEGISHALTDDLQAEQLLDLMVREALKSSEIEGIQLSRRDVISSVRKNLGLTGQAEQVKDKKAAGIAAMLVDARQTFQEPLSEQQLLYWHILLMADIKGVAIGQWRSHKEPMQVVSGASGKEIVHFEAPPSDRVLKEMGAFIQWFNRTAPDGSAPIHAGPVRAAVAHLYFESIHPFEDGNGRIGRVIAEKALSQNQSHPVLLSVSATIEADKNAYYRALEKAQGSNEITAWITYFVNVILEAQQHAYDNIEFTLRKVKFFDRFRNQLNARQLKVIHRMLEEGPGGFEGGINARKYMGLTSISKATTTRDLQDLVEKGILVPKGAGGRSTSYEINL